MKLPKMKYDLLLSFLALILSAYAAPANKAPVSKTSSHLKHFCPQKNVCFVIDYNKNQMTIYSNIKGWVGIGIGSSMKSADIYVASPSTFINTKTKVVNLKKGYKSKMIGVDSSIKANVALPNNLKSKFKFGASATTYTFGIDTTIFRKDNLSKSFIWATSVSAMWGQKHTSEGSFSASNWSS